MRIGRIEETSALARRVGANIERITRWHLWTIDLAEFWRRVGMVTKKGSPYSVWIFSVWMCVSELFGRREFYACLREIGEPLPLYRSTLNWLVSLSFDFVENNTYSAVCDRKIWNLVMQQLVLGVASWHPLSVKSVTKGFTVTQRLLTHAWSARPSDPKHTVPD